jgi:hypothetical protein
MKIPTDYETELQRINKEISELAKNMSDRPIDAGTTTRLLYYMFQRASLTGSCGEFEVTETAID